MRNKRYRPLFVIAFFLCLTVFKCISLTDKYPVRPLLVVYLIALGMLIGALIFGSVQVMKEKSNSESSN